MFAVDVSEDALAVARANAERHGAAITFLAGDLAAPLVPHAPFTLIAANLPYIPTGDARGSPTRGTRSSRASRSTAARTGLRWCGGSSRRPRRCWRRAARSSSRSAKAKPTPPRPCWAEAGFTDVQKKRDLAGIDRVVSGVKP